MMVFEVFSPLLPCVNVSPCSRICSGPFPSPHLHKPLILYITCIMCKLNILFWTWNVPSDFIQQGVFCLVGIWQKIYIYHEKYLLPVGGWCPYWGKSQQKHVFVYFFFFLGSLGQNIIVTLKQDAFIRWPTKIAWKTVL